MTGDCDDCRYVDGRCQDGCYLEQRAAYQAAVPPPQPPAYPNVAQLSQSLEITAACKSLRSRIDRMRAALRRLPVESIRVSDLDVIREALNQSIDHDVSQIESFGRRA